MNLHIDWKISRGLLCASIALLALVASAAQGAEGDSINEKLKKKVSFEFVDTSLEKVATFLTNLTKVPIRIDASVKSPPLINLKVTDMELKIALEWITKLAELEVVVGDKEVVIAPPKK